MPKLKKEERKGEREGGRKEAREGGWMEGGREETREDRRKKLTTVGKDLKTGNPHSLLAGLKTAVVTMNVMWRLLQKLNYHMNVCTNHSWAYIQRTQ